MKRNRGDCDGFSIGTGHGGMKRNRHDRTPDPLSVPVGAAGATVGMDMLDKAKSAGKGSKAPPKDVAPKSAPKKPAPKGGAGKSMKKGTKKADAKAAKRQEMAGAISKAGTDTMAQNKADQERFSAEHDQAAAEGRAYMQRMQQSTPGRAQEIIKNRRA